MKPTKGKSLALLQRTLERVSDVAKLQKYSPDHEKWERNARNAIRFIFGDESQHLKEFESTLKPYSSEDKLYPATKADAFRKVSPKVATLFEIMINEVEDYWEQDVDTAGINDIKKDASVLPRDNNIFIIHGHDAGTKEEVARFLSKLGLNPIILHEQANKGKTVIEKFEQHADVPFAIALLTPDDIGASKSEPERLRPRPRQNVLFEFGYFIGKLGRTRVCGLIKGEVEIPSDYSGVLYINFDSADWRWELIKELKAANLPIDVNTAL
jgi:predicted nucleotide-binding protein